MWRSPVKIDSFTQTLVNIEIRIKFILTLIITDSLIFIEKHGIDPPIPLGNFLGELTDEVPQGFHIVKIVVTGCKSYAYMIHNPTTNETRAIVKVKGISLNNEAVKTVSFNTMEAMVLAFVNENELIQKLVRQRAFRARGTFDQTMLVRRFDKVFRVTSEKRITKGFSTVPYGFADET